MTLSLAHTALSYYFSKKSGNLPSFVALTLTHQSVGSGYRCIFDIPPEKPRPYRYTCLSQISFRKESSTRITLIKTTLTAALLEETSGGISNWCLGFGLFQYQPPPPTTPLLFISSPKKLEYGSCLSKHSHTTCIAEMYRDRKNPDLRLNTSQLPCHSTQREDHAYPLSLSSLPNKVSSDKNFYFPSWCFQSSTPASVKGDIAWSPWVRSLFLPWRGDRL